MNGPSVRSQRAQSILTAPKFQHSPPETGVYGHRQYDDGRLVWWQGSQNCEAWGYAGKWSDDARALLEAAGTILKNQRWARLQELGARELEFFLRDKNSQIAITEAALSEFTSVWGELQASVHNWLQSGVSLAPYRYSQKAVFRSLPLADKIHELKAFFLSDKLQAFYQRGGKLEVLDVVESTVYLALETGDIPQGAFLDWLQIIAAETFSDSALNLIPEDFIEVRGQK